MTGFVFDIITAALAAGVTSHALTMVNNMIRAVNYVIAGRPHRSNS
jgi:hypothetical protein